MNFILKDFEIGDLVVINKLTLIHDECPRTYELAYHEPVSGCEKVICQVAKISSRYHPEDLLLLTPKDCGWIDSMMPGVDKALALQHNFWYCKPAAIIRKANSWNDL